MKVLYAIIAVLLIVDGVLIFAGVGDDDWRHTIALLCFLVGSLYLDKVPGDR